MCFKEPHLLDVQVCVSCVHLSALPPSPLQRQQAKHATRNAQAVARGRLQQQRRDPSGSGSAGEENKELERVPVSGQVEGGAGHFLRCVLATSLQAWIQTSTVASWEGCSQPGRGTVHRQPLPLGVVCLHMLML